MNLSVVQLIKLGKKYLSLWPNKPELSQYFEDYRGVQVARFVCRSFPALAMFTIIMQLYFASGYPLGQGSISQALNALPNILVYGIFIISVPLQALIFSGVKADKLLPPALASWYYNGLDKIEKKIAEQGHTNNEYSKMIAMANLSKYKPRYIDLAQLLQLTFSTSKS